MNSGDLITVAAAALDSWPVGACYTQYPNTPAPAIIFGGIWANISVNYAGLFFRAEGGNAAAFNTTGVTIQAQDLQPHSHSGGAVWPGSGPEQNQSGGVEDRTTFNIQTGITGNVETRPINTAIRIWQRTA